jgi:DNA-binding CsgD family transcriptional regulator
VLLGRTTERARIERLLDDARQGRGGALVIRGEPGIGKTSLLRYALDLAEAMTVVRATGVESEAELEYSGLAELCRPILYALEELPAHQADTLAGVLGLSPRASADRFTVGAATLGLLALVAESRPVLVVVDDAQWIDAASAAALTFAARRLGADAVAFLLAARDGSSVFASGFDELALDGLDAESSKRLLEVASAGEVSDAVAAALLASTRGNPLGLVELPRVLSSEQLSGRERIEDPLPVGEGVKLAYSSVIGRLPEDTSYALVVLAVSSSGEADVLAEALSSVGGVQALEPAEDAALVSLDDGCFVFPHPLVRSAVVQSAPASSRRSAHRALADALTRPGHEERCAWHLAAAAVGPDEGAAAALAAAAATARERGGHEAACEAFERAARLTSAGPLARDRLADAAEAAWSAGDSARAARLADEVLSSSDDPRLRARLLGLRGRIELQAGTAAGSRDLFVQAADVVEQDDPAVAAGLLGLAVAACHHGGMMGEGLLLAERARGLVPRDGGAADRQSEYMLGRALRLAGRAEDGARILGPVLERLLETGDLGVAGLTQASIAAAVLERDGESRELAGRATRLARESGPMLLLQTLTLLAETCVRQGEWQRAVAAASEGLALAGDLGQPNVRAYFLQSLLRVDGARGNEQACREAAQQALPLIRASGVAIPAVLVNGALGLLELGLDRLEDAVATLAEASELAVSKGMFGRDILPEIDLVEALVRLGRGDEAQARFQAWRGRGGHEGSRLVEALAARCRGLLADEGDFEPAFEEALGLHAAGINPFAEARTRLCYGERLRRAGRRIDARRQLRAALETFEALEAAAWIKRARRELRATGEKLGRRAAASGDELTPQELQVALQVAEGRTNREVGAALFLSPKTVEFHLARVYRKLDISSRADLIRRFATAAAAPEPAAATSTS